MHTITIYSPHAGPRLRYVLDWVLKERLCTNYTLTTNENEATNAAVCIAYGKPIAGHISIPDCGLLAAGDTGPGSLSAGVRPVTPATGHWQSIPTLFADDTTRSTLPFDLFSAIFYLISRYEEYLPYTPDKHGRFAAVESILFKNGWLQRPLIDEWIHALGQLLQQHYNIDIAPAGFTFLPTYDIDMAYSHVYKGFGRIAGAYLRALLKGDVEQINERTRVLKKKEVDPYDSFAWLRSQHEQYHLKPLYFVLSALKTTPFDKNIHPRHPAMMRVTRQLAKEGTVGIHPSYYANRYDVAAKETNTLKDIIGKSVPISRQHYIRLMIPVTYHLLMDIDITDDFSMGYGTHLGFRAGTGSSFPWYDLSKESVTPIRTHPFCFMDTTAHFDQGMNCEEAFKTLYGMAEKLRLVNSTLVTIFHNFSLGTDKQWNGWSDAYAAFLKNISQ